jgi:5-methylcytosine-specific restriction endonuclease McrA
VRAWYHRNRDHALAQGKEWRQNNVDRCRKLSYAWRDQNQEKSKQINRDYYARNKERKAAEKREWRKAHPAEAAAIKKRWMLKYPNVEKAIRVNKKARRRSLEKSATGKISAADIKALWIAQNGKCLYCTKPLDDSYHIDHKIPLVHGGSHQRTNLALSCPTCNLQKGPRLDWRPQCLTA